MLIIILHSDCRVLLTLLIAAKVELNVAQSQRLTPADTEMRRASKSENSRHSIAFRYTTESQSVDSRWIILGTNFVKSHQTI